MNYKPRVKYYLTQDQNVCEKLGLNQQDNTDLLSIAGKKGVTETFLICNEEEVFQGYKKSGSF